MFHRPIDILRVIERLDLIGLAFFFMGVLLVYFLIIGTHILLLDEGGVGEHERTQVASRRSAVDIALETFFDHIRDEPRVVYMRMGEHDTIECRRIETEVAVFCVRLHAFSLIHPAIQEDRVTRIGRDQMFASRHFARCA